MVKDHRKYEMDYIDTNNKPKLYYIAEKFIIHANPNNALEMFIIDLFNNDPSFQKALEFEEPNKKYHRGEDSIVGVHIQNTLAYCDYMSSWYKSWKNDSTIIRPALMWHDIGKIDELSFAPRKHPQLASEEAEVLYSIKDETFLKLVSHHDDHYKLYNKSKNPEIMEIFKERFAHFTKREIGVLVRFGYADRYKILSKDDIKKQDIVEDHKEIKKEYQDQMKWFIKMAKSLSLLDKDFKPFS